MLGLGLGLWGNVAATSGGGGGGGGWNPTQSSTALAAWFDPSDITTLFQDTAGTVPVTADGDLVRLMKDKSGNGFDATMPYGTSFAPTYHTGSGKPYLQVANDRWLETASHQFVNATDGSGSAGVGWISTDNTGTQRITMQGSTLSGITNNAGTSEAIAVRASDSASIGDTGDPLTVGTSYSLIKIATASTIEMFVNNSSGGSTASGGAWTTSANQLGLMGAPGSDGRATGKYYGSAHYTGALSSGDRASLSTFLLGKMP